MIEAVLFDADGVLQRRPDGWKDALSDVLGFQGDTDLFLSNVFVEEAPALNCALGISDGLSRVLSTWACRASLEETLDVWTTIQVTVGMRDIILDLRRRGTRCYLASNQEPYKATFMSERLGYGDLFDREFYSCQLGFAKPSPAYFRAVIKEIGIHPEQALFIDDSEANVESAHSCGLVAYRYPRFGDAAEMRRVLTEHGLNVAEAKAR